MAQQFGVTSEPELERHSFHQDEVRIAQSLDIDPKASCARVCKIPGSSRGLGAWLVACRGKHIGPGDWKNARIPREGLKILCDKGEVSVPLFAMLQYGVGCGLL